MARQTTLLQDRYPYHVYNRVLDRRFYPSTEAIWDVYCDALLLSAWTRGLRVHAFVLMSNHYHLLASTPDSNLHEAMQVFQSHVSQTIIRRTAESALRFGTRYRWCLLADASHVRNVYRYTYQNPLRAGLTSRCELYAWSTLHGALGLGKLRTPLWPLPEMPTEEIALPWLNEWQGPHCDDLCRRGLRRREFAIPMRAPASSRRHPGLRLFYDDALSDKK